MRELEMKKKKKTLAKWEKENTSLVTFFLHRSEKIWVISQVQSCFLLFYVSGHFWNNIYSSNDVAIPVSWKCATVPIPFRPSIVMTLLSLQTHGIISPTHRSACVCLATRRGRRCSHASCWATTSLLKVLTRWIYNLIKMITMQTF